MTTDALAVGTIVRYPYLWEEQAADGKTEGAKDRPVCLIWRETREDQTHLFLLPLTTKEPPADRRSLRVPDTEMRRLNLPQRVAGWVIVDEYNYDVLPASYYFSPSPEAVVGRFSKPFLEQVAASFREALRLKEAKSVRRL